MQKLRTQRGITLIALIITIIVMLILVGVSVTVALNGGLFTTAKEATGRTQIEIDKEQLLELALGAMNDKGKVVIGDLDTAVAADERFTGTGGTYTSVKSGKTYTVNGWGGVAETPVYELSGKWRFKDTIDLPELEEGEKITISQDITFTADSYIAAGEGGIDSYIEQVTFENITWYYGFYNDGEYSYLDCMVYFDGSEVFNINGGWSLNMGYR